MTSGYKMLALYTEHFYALEFLGVCLDFSEGWRVFCLFFFFKFGSDEKIPLLKRSDLLPDYLLYYSVSQILSQEV